MKEKGKEVVYISNENEVLPIGVLLKKKETIETIVQNNVWEYQDKTIGMDTQQIEITKLCNDVNGKYT